MAVQQLAQIAEQVVVVEQAALALVVPVIVRNLAQLVQLVEQVRKLFVQHRRHAAGLVGRQAQDFQNGLLAGKAERFLVQTHTAADQIDHVLGVAAVQNGEGVGKAQQLGVAAQDGVGKGVKGAAGDPVAAAAQERLNPLQHLFGRPPGKGQQQDGGRVNPLLNHARHPEHQGAGLAAARPGQDQQRPPVGDGRLVLGGVEFLLVVDQEAPGPVVGLRAQCVSVRSRLVAHRFALHSALCVWGRSAQHSRKAVRRQRRPFCADKPARVCYVHCRCPPRLNTRPNR